MNLPKLFALSGSLLPRILHKHFASALLLVPTIAALSSNAWAVCGDGVVEYAAPNFESCDDNNTANNDGCANDCTVEFGARCLGQPSVCSITVAPFYGTGLDNTGAPLAVGQADQNWAPGTWLVQPPIGDAPNRDDGQWIDLEDDCISQTLSIVGATDPTSLRLELVVSVDDDITDVSINGTTIGNLGLTAADLGQPWENTFPVQIPPGPYWVAGNNTVEICNENSGGGPSGINVRVVAASFTSCGDSVVDPGEACDDGNVNNNDGCDTLCRFDTLLDSDGDGDDNVVDADDDNDGIPDSEEVGALGGDSDDDQIFDYLDPSFVTCADTAPADGQCDTLPVSVDADGDGTPNHLDLDSDDDTIFDIVEAGGTDANDNGLVDTCADTAPADGQCDGTILNNPPNTDGALGEDYLDPDSDNDGVGDDIDLDRLDANVCRDTDADSCDDCVITGDDESGGDPDNDGPDQDSDGLCDDGDSDTDNDGVANATDTDALDPNVCADSDADGCDDCAVTGDDESGGDPDNDGPDTNSDGECNDSDDDDDGDGVLDTDDESPLNPTACMDTDADGCDDCAVTGPSGGGAAPANDGVDVDADGACDVADTDSDNDGVDDGADAAAGDPNVCRDVDGDSCDDCVNTGADGSGGDVADDGTDTDSDGLCDAGDNDDDGDGVDDGGDEDPLDPEVCLDGDADGCDDCSVSGPAGGGATPANDGPDFDTDGVCDLSDPNPDDADGDGVEDGDDSDPADPTVCLDSDNDGCDDCALSGANSSGGEADNDGTDTDSDGACDLGDSDDDNDGVDDADDSDAVDPALCLDSDNDGCDDCSVTGADQSGGDPSNDGPDSDGDGLCDAVVSGDAGTTVPEPDAAPDAGGSVPEPEDTATSSDDPSSSEGSSSESSSDDSEGVPVDRDNDGLSDDVECPGGFAQDSDDDGQEDCVDADDDNDGVPTANETDNGAPIDSDGDGTPDYLDTDDDNDGILTEEETDNGAPIDSDSDGKPDFLDKDDDNDGIPTAAESADPNHDGHPEDAQDTDDDGKPDYLDKDDDDDSIPTAAEHGDKDGNGVRDYLEASGLPLLQGGGFDCGVAGTAPNSRTSLFFLWVALGAFLTLVRRR